LQRISLCLGHGHRCGWAWQRAEQRRTRSLAGPGPQALARVVQEAGAGPPARVQGGAPAEHARVQGGAPR